jgi:hypothetical protein
MQTDKPDYFTLPTTYYILLEQKTAEDGSVFYVDSHNQVVKVGKNKCGINYDVEPPEEKLYLVRKDEDFIYTYVPRMTHYGVVIRGVFATHLVNGSHCASSIAIAGILPIEEYYKWQYPNHCLDILRRVPQAVKFIREPTEEMRHIVIDKNPNLITQLRGATGKDWMRAVLGNPLLIEQAPATLLYNRKLILRLVKVDGSIYTSLPELYHRDVEVRSAAIESNPTVIKYITEPTFEEQMAAVKADPKCIKYLHAAPPPVQLEAVRHHFSMCDLIANPCQEVIDFITKRLIKCSEAVKKRKREEEQTKAQPTASKKDQLSDADVNRMLYELSQEARQPVAKSEEEDTELLLKQSNVVLFRGEHYTVKPMHYEYFAPV